MFVAGAATIFIARGPMRATRSGLDFAAPYAGAIAWRSGANPYDSTVLATILTRAGRERDATPAFTPALYPPPTFAILWPYSLLSWKAARLAWLLTGLLLMLCHVRALYRLANFRATELSGILLLGGVLALAPYGSGIALGQLVVASVALLVVAIERIEHDAPVGGGIALGFAVMLKPQIALPFVLYFALRDRWRACLAATISCAVIAAAAVEWLALNGVQWLPAMRANLSRQAHGGVLDPTGPLSAQMIDLRPLLAAVTSDHAPDWLGSVLCILVAIVLGLLGRKLERKHELPLVASVSVVVLLAGYHRFYDAALLSLPLAAAIGAIRFHTTAIRSDTRMHRLALYSIACCAVFFVPGAWTLAIMAQRGLVPQGVSESLVWNVLLLRHQVWTLVFLEGVLIAMLNRLASVQHEDQVVLWTRVQ